MDTVSPMLLPKSSAHNLEFNMIIFVGDFVLLSGTASWHRVIDIVDPMHVVLEDNSVVETSDRYILDYRSAGEHARATA